MSDFYYIEISGFPCGGYVAKDAETHETLRLGVPRGEHPKRHKTPAAVRRAVERFYRRKVTK